MMLPHTTERQWVVASTSVEHFDEEQQRLSKGVVPMDRTLLNMMVWILFLGGLFGFVVALAKFFGGGSAAEYGVMGIGGGFWLLASATTIYYRSKLTNPA